MRPPQQSSLTFQDNLKGTKTEKFISALQSPEIKQRIYKFESSNIEHISNINEIVGNFVNIIEEAAKKSLQLVNTKTKSRKRCSRLWFDDECRNVRAILRRVSEKIHNNPFNRQ